MTSIGVMRGRKRERIVKLCGFMKWKRCFFFNLALYVDFIELIFKVRMD